MIPRGNVRVQKKKGGGKKERKGVQHACGTAMRGQNGRG